MEKQILWVGNSQKIRKEALPGVTEPVSFLGEKLAIATLYAEDHKTWQRKETLFRDEEGHLLVYVEDRSQTPDGAYKLYEATKADLGVRGRFASLGHGGWFLALPDAGDGQPQWT